MVDTKPSMEEQSFACLSFGVKKFETRLWSNNPELTGLFSGFFKYNCVNQNTIEDKNAFYLLFIEGLLNILEITPMKTSIFSFLYPKPH